MINLSKRTLIIASTVLTLGVTGGATYMAITPTPKTGADTSPIVTQIDNHETRIKNLEGNVTVLQTKTGTAPAATNTPVPVVTAPVVSSPTTTTTPVDTVPTATVAPVVVTAYKEIVIDADTSDCQYTYSDGSTYVFHWKTRGPDSWVTDGNGDNGHSVKSINHNGYCDKNAIGIQKIN